MLRQKLKNGHHSKILRSDLKKKKPAKTRCTTRGLEIDAPSYLLGKGGYVFGGVGLSVCLFVDNITQKVMNGLGRNFRAGSWVVQ